MEAKNITQPWEPSAKAKNSEAHLERLDKMSERELWRGVAQIDRHMKKQNQTTYTKQVFHRTAISRFSFEQIIVSYCMAQSLEGFAKCKQFINEDWFKDQEHYIAPYDPHKKENKDSKKGLSKKIFLALCTMEAQGISPRNIHAINEITRLDFSTLIDILDAAYWVKDFTQFVVYTKAMEELHLTRKMDLIADDISNGVIKDKFELIDAADKIVFPADSERDDIDALNMKILEAEERAMIYKKTGERDPNSILYGIPELDKLTGGMNPEEFVVIGARPAMGKTTLLRQILEFNAPYRPVLFLSVEMGKEQIHRLYACNFGEVSSFRMRRKTYHQGEYHKFMEGLSKAGKMYIPKGQYEYTKGLRIDDTAPLRLDDLKKKVARFCEACKVPPLIGLDYLQLVQGPQNQKRKDLEVGAISQALKLSARSFGATVITLSQLSRSVESRGGDKRPILSDLRESGSIEQDADTVLFLYRPDYYGFEVDDEGNSTQGLAEIIAAKTRYGPTGVVKSKFATEYGGQFLDWGYESHETKSNSLPTEGIETDTYEEENPDF